MNVLVVDDDKVDRIVVRELLEKEFTIFEAESEESVHRCMDSQQIDCVLLDYLIPGTDSLLLLGKIAEKRVPVIMLTGEGNEKIAVNAMKLGAQDYLNKRNLAEELLTRTITNAVGTIELERKLDEKKRELVVANDQLQHKVHELQILNQDLESVIHLTAHDLREPLRNLCGYCGLLKREAGEQLSASCRHYIESIERGAKKLSTLIDNLRMLTRVVYTKAELETIDLNTVVRDIVEDLKPVLESRNVRVIQDSLPSVSGLRVLVEQLYRNLFDNAVKYGPKSDMSIHIGAEQLGSGWVFTVHNSGSAIPQEDLTRIFQPFYRLAQSKNIDGTGMGLALCKKIVERHGGKIWVESAPSDGVRIQFTLSEEAHG